MLTKATPILAEPYLSRFLERIAQLPNGCWHWLRPLDAHGYGRLSIGGTNGGNHFKAHRLSYVYFIGEIQDGLTIDHLCRNRACVNPTHLEPVPSAVNVGRGTSAQVLRERNKHQYWWTPEARAKIAASNRRRAFRGAA